MVALDGGGVVEEQEQLGGLPALGALDGLLDGLHGVAGLDFDHEVGGAGADFCGGGFGRE